MSEGLNPKAIAGRKKRQFQYMPIPVLLEIADGMTEGAEKYGAYNWRQSKVSATDYYDSTMRHLLSWFDGEDTDPESGISHISKAIAGLVVVRDAMIQDKFVDDRPSCPK